MMIPAKPYGKSNAPQTPTRSIWNTSMDARAKLNAPQTPAHKHRMRRKLQPTSIKCAANSSPQASNAPQTPANKH